MDSHRNGRTYLLLACVWKGHVSYHHLKRFSRRVRRVCRGRSRQGTNVARACIARAEVTRLLPVGRRSCRRAAVHARVVFPSSAKETVRSAHGLCAERCVLKDTDSSCDVGTRSSRRRSSKACSRYRVNVVASVELESCVYEGEFTSFSLATVQTISRGLSHYASLEWVMHMRYYLDRREKG